MKANTEFQVSGSAAERYEEYLVPVIFTPWAEHLLNLADLKPDSALLDVACGTGIVARMARERIGAGGRVTGLDLNPEMLSLARREADGMNIEWVQSDATTMPFDDDSFDVLTCQQGLQFFPNKPAALTEFRRVLKPGGQAVACVIRSLAMNPLISTQVAALEKHFEDDVTGAMKAVCQLPDAAVIEDLFTGAGFSDVTIDSVSLTLRHPDARAFVTGLLLATPLAELIAGMPKDSQSQIIDDILEGFKDCVDGEALAFPHISHVITARA